MGANQTIARLVRSHVPYEVKRVVPLGIRRRIALGMGITEYDLVGDHVSFREEGFVKAPTPAYLLARHNHEERAIRDALAGQRFVNALEIGCGYGRLSPTVTEHADRLTSIDPNLAALSMARECYPGIDYREGAANELPFADGAFDLVVSWTVLQHVPPGQFDEVTRELMRVISPGGTLLLCETTVDIPVTYTAETLTWARTVDDYCEAFSMLVLERKGSIETIDRIDGLGAPGTVMVFRRVAYEASANLRS